jgi:DNA-binding PucR family transcriptional regulator
MPSIKWRSSSLFAVTLLSVGALGGRLGAPHTSARNGARGPGHESQIAGLHQVLLGARATAELELLASQMLEPLLSHDARRGTELITTCQAFLECRGNVEAIARVLWLHPNTIRGRISRIETLLRRALDEARTRLDLHLALETLQLAAPK